MENNHMKKLILIIAILLIGLSGSYAQRKAVHVDFGATRGFVSRYSKAYIKHDDQKAAFNISIYGLAIGTDKKVENSDDIFYDPYFSMGAMIGPGVTFFMGEHLYAGIDFTIGAGVSYRQRFQPDSYIGSGIYMGKKILEPTLAGFNYNVVYLGADFGKFTARIGATTVLTNGFEHIGFRTPISISCGFNL
jgi:hypothetical protein